MTYALYSALLKFADFKTPYIVHLTSALHPFLRPRTQRQQRFIPRPTKRSPNPTGRKIHHGIRIRRSSRNRLRHRHIIRRRNIHLAITLRAARILWVYTDDVVNTGDVIHVRYGLEPAVAVVGTGDGGGDGGGIGGSDGDGGVDAGGGNFAAVGREESGGFGDLGGGSVLQV